MNRSLLSAAVGAALLATATACSDGDAADATGSKAGLDTAFGKAGVVASPLSADADDRFLAVAPGPSGSFYAAGFIATGEDHAMALARFGADGVLDRSFGTNGVASVNVAAGGKGVEVARGLVVQADGKIVVSGPVEHDTSASGDAAKDNDVAAVRFDAKGAVDPSFGAKGVARVDLGTGRKGSGESFLADNAWGATALPDGRIVLFGVTPAPGAGRTDQDFALVALTAAGALDKSFGTAGVTRVGDEAGASPRNVIVHGGKIVAAGYARGKDDVVRPVVIRTDLTGALDKSFGTGGVATDTVLPGVAESYSIGVQGSDYVLAGYGRGASSEEKVDMIVYRFTGAGQWDKTFGTDGLVRIDRHKDEDRGRNVAVLPDGRVLVVGSTKKDGNADAMAVLLDKNGAAVTGFGKDGYAAVDLGGPSDAWFGVTVAGDTAVLVGYKGAGDAGNDDAAIGRVKLG